MAMTRMQEAREGKITEEVAQAASTEGVPPEQLRDAIARGWAVIARNRVHSKIVPLAIGRGLRTKINANLGTSKDRNDPELELCKLKVSVEAGADTVMDLSTGSEIDAMRKLIIEHSPVPVGTVPIYQAAVEAGEISKSAIRGMTVEKLFSTLEKHAEDGVDFMTVHCGVTRESAERYRRQGRILDVVSRGGSFIIEWMHYNKRENPLYEFYDRLLELAAAYDVTLSLGDGLRPGCLADATDRGQVQELILLGELTERAWEKGVQVMIEGPGHVPIHQIEANVLLEKELCRGAPFYVLGPLVTDIAPGYDHITSAIGGAIAAKAGADFLCYVTPSEHLRLPTLEDVKEGVIASCIAAHAADIAKGVKGAMDRDILMAKRRKALDWEGMYAQALDPEKAKSYREGSLPSDGDVCTMCSDLCAIKVMK
ncbi:MAG: phosphomethylpyrimidine synthase ThiC [Nitrospinota bacterium]